MIDRHELEADWPTWLRVMFGRWFWAPFAEHHCDFWDWVQGVRPAAAPPPYVAIWSRGHTKSTNAEAAVVNLGARSLRRYFLYVCAVQDQADDHVSNIAALLESPEFGQLYPEHADRALSKFGSSKAWRRNRLWTRGGLIVDALGLDVASRGLKLEDARPDGLVLDDIDSDFDPPPTTEKKLQTISRKILPALTDDAAIMAVQNLIIAGGVFGRLAGSADVPRTDVLADRVVNGPIPAALDLEYEQSADGRWNITAGVATWAGQPIVALQRELDKMGLSAFLAEKQHATIAAAGGIYDHVNFRHVEFSDVPELLAKECWVDPAVSDTDNSDAHAIQLDGLGRDNTIYRLFSWERRASPEQAIGQAIRVAVDLNCPTVGVETDQGGDAWRSVWKVAIADAAKAAGRDDLDRVSKIESLRFKTDKAGRTKQSKTERSTRMLADYERGGIVHVRGTHDVLERALRRAFKVKPFDLADAAYWSHRYLRERSRGPIRVSDPSKIRLGVYA